MLKANYAVRLGATRLHHESTLVSMHSQALSMTTGA